MIAKDCSCLSASSIVSITKVLGILFSLDEAIENRSFAIKTNSAFGVSKSLKR